MVYFSLPKSLTLRRRECEIIAGEQNQMRSNVHVCCASGLEPLMRSSLSTATPDSPRAWLMVGVAFLASFVVFGVMYSFGAFFAPMAAEFQASRAATSAFFAITGFVNYMLAALTGHLSDRFGPRIVVGAGAVVVGAGLGVTR